MKKFRSGDGSGNSTVRVTGMAQVPNGAMTTSLFTSIRADLARRASKLDDPARTLRPPGEDRGPEARAAIAEARGGPVRSERAAVIVRALSQRVPADELATLAVLVALEPVLARFARRLVHQGIPGNEAVSVVVDTALSVLAGGPGGTETLGALGARIWNRCRRELRRQRRAQRAQAHDVPERAVEGAGVLGTPPVATVLARALAEGVLTPTEVRLIVATRMDEQPFDEAAAVWGMTVVAARSWRRRAETRLRAFVEGREVASCEG